MRPEYKNGERTIIITHLKKNFTVIKHYHRSSLPLKEGGLPKVWNDVFDSYRKESSTSLSSEVWFRAVSHTGV
jgi:hypothetical protein